MDVGGISPETDIAIEGGRIAAVGPAAVGMYPEAERIDLGGHYIMPGIVDPWLRLDAGNLFSAADFLASQLLAGTTTAHIVGVSSDSGFALRRAAQEGLYPSPRLIFAGDPILAPPSTVPEDANTQYEHLRVAARRRLGMGADLLLLEIGPDPERTRFAIVEEVARDLRRQVVYSRVQSSGVPDTIQGQGGTVRRISEGTHSSLGARLRSSLSHGASLPEAVGELTFESAELLGLGEEIGAIDVGKRPDLVAFRISADGKLQQDNPSVVIQLAQPPMARLK